MSGPQNREGGKKKKTQVEMSWQRHVLSSSLIEDRCYLDLFLSPLSLSLGWLWSVWSVAAHCN
ncbi:hypothetical protein GIB67_014628 [Kingdonia uniflora]|uniref:Uncharacterized protein n=1 Tax=Kingdonia uniflora TaxID=39325 RepID=A0A7J7NVW2_9MAGN|nr:hypothetical protein GIB67_014628 [Kingdonia uniflora]